MLLKRYDPAKHDPTGWLMMEKYDGVRAYWDGRSFRSRSGKIAFKAPGWFTAPLPNIVLDGELHGGRGNFSKACGIARRLDADEEWKELTFTIFDAPNHPGTYCERIDFVADLGSLARYTHIGIVTPLTVHDPYHLAQALQNIEAMGGEGLVLRHPTAPYEWKRTGNALKVKSEQDAEATVIGTTAGTGKHEGRMGALICRMANGVEFKVGTGFDDAERERPDWIGGLITFSYFEIFEKTGKPRHPTFVRIRTE